MLGGYIPVISPLRAGAQTPACEKHRVNRTPSAASRSMWGEIA
jgi:hypothetical protein